MTDVKESTQYDNFVGKKEKVQHTLDDFLGVEIESPKNAWERHWQDMPEFEQENDKAFKTINVHFRTEEDYKEFAEMIGQKLSDKTKTIWHPKLDITKNSLLRWVEDDES